MKTTRKTLWETADEYALQTRSGMRGVFHFLASVHPTTDKQRQELTECWDRYNEQMNTWATIRR